MIEDNLVNAVIYVYAEQKRFYFFTRDQIHKLLRDKGDLKHDTIKKYGKQYALLDSYFYAYKGDEWDAYDKRKEELTNAKLQEYIKNRKTGPTLSTKKIAETLDVSTKTIYRHLQEALEKGELDETEVKNPAGMWRLRTEHVDWLRDRMSNQSKESIIDNTRRTETEEATP